MNSVLALAAAAAVVAAPQGAQTKDLGRSQLVTTVEACRPITDNNARLACYDRAVGALAAASARGEIAVVDRNQVREVRRSLFGFAIPKLPFFGGKDRGAEPEPKELVSTLTSFRSIGNGFFRFGLAEPQSTWEATEAASVVDPRVGAKVTIKRGALGSYWAEIENEPAARVRRIR